MKDIKEEEVIKLMKDLAWEDFMGKNFLLKFIKLIEETLDEYLKMREVIWID